MHVEGTAKYRRFHWLGERNKQQISARPQQGMLAPDWTPV